MTQCLHAQLMLEGCTGGMGEVMEIPLDKSYGFRKFNLHCKIAFQYCLQISGLLLGICLTLTPSLHFFMFVG